MSHRFEPLKKEPAYVKVYNAVEADILSGRLSEGSVLPTEAQLCEQFAITRATVREGLRLLERSDLVQRGAAKRFYVKRPDTVDIATMTSKSLALGGVTFKEVWEALSTMYPDATRIAAKRFSAQDLKILRDAHSHFKAEKNLPSDEIVEHAVEFFQLIACAVDNRVMQSLLQALNMLIGASLNQVISKTPKARARIVSAQAKIIDALEARDEDEAARWIAKHIDDLKRGYTVAKVELEKPVL